jgi:hypothetical protein
MENPSVLVIEVSLRARARRADFQSTSQHLTDLVSFTRAHSYAPLYALYGESFGRDGLAAEAAEGIE